MLIAKWEKSNTDKWKSHYGVIGTIKVVCGKALETITFNRKGNCSSNVLISINSYCQIEANSQITACIWAGCAIKKFSYSREKEVQGGQCELRQNRVVWHCRWEDLMARSIPCSTTKPCLMVKNTMVITYLSLLGLLLKTDLLIGRQLLPSQMKSLQTSIWFSKSWP